MAGTAAHATEAAAETAAPGTAPEGAAAHAAKAAARRPGPAGAVVAARRGRRIVRTSGTPPSVGRPWPTEAPQPAAGAGKNIGHRPDDDDKQNHADHKGQDVGQGAAAAALLALIAGLHGAAGKADPVDVRDGVCHVPGTGGHRAVIIFCGELIFHGLGDGAGLLCQRGVAEAVAVGQVVVAVRVLRRFHHQQDQHAVVFGGRADAPGVESLCGVILRGIITRVFYCQYTDLCAAAAGFQLCVQLGDGLHGAAAQHTGTVHHALVLRQAGQLGGKGRRAQHCRADHHGQHQCADAFCKVFHAKGSTSFTPDKASSTLAGKPPTSF